MKKNNYSNIAAIAVNKSLLKEYQTSYGRTVYLDKDSEFQIKLFNPYTYTIGAEIIINGKSLGDTLIIRPGQLIWLERYFNEARKFRFDVYEVDAQAEAVKEAIKNNGDIVIKFYKEREDPMRGINIWISNAPGYNGTTYTNGIPDVCKNMTFSTNDAVNTTYKGATCDSFSMPLSCDIPTYTSCSSDQYYDVRGITKRKRKASIDSAISSTMETGRVEKGGYSDQRFTMVDVNLESWPFVTEEFKLLPKSQKPVYKEDLEKLYCPNCGRKVKTKFKYCPFCGEKL